MLTVVCVGSIHLQEGINPAQGVFIEMFATSFLVLAVFMLAVEKHHATPFAPVSLPNRRVAIWPLTLLSLEHYRSGSGLLSSLVNCAKLDMFRPWPWLITSASWSAYFTGGALNTARAFGPAVITGFPYGTHWVVCTVFSKLRVSSHWFSIGLARAWGRSLGQGSIRFLSGGFPR